AFEHPSFDYESRIVTVALDGVTFASIYVPNGGKDFPAKMRFLEGLREYTATLHAGGGRVVLCGDLNIARPDMDVHPRSASRARSASFPRNGRCSRRSSATASSTPGARSSRTTIRCSRGGPRGATC